MSISLIPFATIFNYINRNKTLIMSQKITYSQVKNDRYYIKKDSYGSIDSYEIVLVTSKTNFYLNYQEISNKNNSPSNDYIISNNIQNIRISNSEIIEKDTRQEIIFYYIGSKEFIENKEESYNLANQSRQTSNYQTPPSSSSSSSSSRLHNEFAGVERLNPLNLRPSASGSYMGNYYSGGGSNGMFINTTGLNYGAPQMLFPDIFESLVSGATTPTISSSSSSSSASKIKPTDIEELKDEETEQEKEQYKEAFRCKICYMNKINITLIPCGHLFCSECDKKRTKKECPICRKEVKDTQAIFLN
jgi:hypothetical protein